MPRSVKYHIENTGGYPTIKWGEECDITANDLGVKIGTSGNCARDEAIEFLRDILKGDGLPEKEVKELATNAGIKERTLFRAKQMLHVRSVKTGYADSTWTWRLPGSVIEDCQPIPE
jgi:hypothetical protein